MPTPTGRRRSWYFAALFALSAALLAPGSAEASVPAFAGIQLPALPVELLSPAQRLSEGPDAHGYPMQAFMPLLAVPTIPAPDAMLPRTLATLAAASSAILLALNLAFVGHLRRAYSSPRRKTRRRG